MEQNRVVLNEILSSRTNKKARHLERTQQQARYLERTQQQARHPEVFPKDLYFVTFYAYKIMI